MKKLYFLFVFFIFLSSCEKKDVLVPENEIPGWLKTQIQTCELTIQQDPDSYINSGVAWIRYKWNDNYYFEYRNMISATVAYPISFDQDTLKVCPVCSGEDYHDNKCCKQFAWKGTKYIDTGD
jgi:hypothetical protein